MAYQALYRLYRPQQFEDMVGQEHITKTLQNALLQQKLSHAYLFSGPRGTGKTSAAKIIAKAVNCAKAPVAEPCNECEACLGITKGSNSDVIEIDAASNNGVDEIRDIRDKVKYAPSSVQYKVYIIDEVHMLSIGAFNALLKTLEEPPAHVIFILATTEPHKIPLTIISRCQRFDFRRITSHAIVKRMQTVIASQNVPVEEEALQLVARAAEGGMRDALSILDQAVSYSEDTVTTEDVLAVTGSVSQTFLSEMTRSFQEHQVVDALRQIDQLMDKGKDPIRFINDLIFYYRDMLLYQAAPNLEEVLDRAQVDQEFEMLAKKIQGDWIYQVIDILNKAQQEMKWTNHPRIHLELAIVKLCQEESAPKPSGQTDVQPLINRIEQLEKELTKLKEQGVPAASSDAAQEPAKPKRTFQSKTPKSKASTGRIKEMLKGASKKDLQLLRSKWGDIMERIKSRMVNAHAWMINATPVASSDNAFLLAFQHELHSQMAVKENIRECVESVVQETLGQQMTMMTILEEDWEKVKQSFIEEQRQSDSTDIIEEEEPSTDSIEDKPESNSKKEEDPIVEEAVKLFGSEYVEVED
ncbi:DNA polymerase III subunit gamma/tau [Pseudalkalibacillus berkeleyi]|uniref:DNA-directed DNA polymerase n=1 Tax=Pseudalkalibacillus berkeleyi TaxID=1069813 RepID=A0ABS9H3U0_9BACL|nr:DNA polymerase III subunit gamma/tau [Pseudalkalibacillus berkeleyi]MCF6139618.1 DNA polymerase III subunit gamma/tau [Pseudalkalibacillus berkeleyi]